MNKLLFPLLAMIAAVGIYFMYIRPTMAEIEQDEITEALFEKQLEEAREIESILRTLESTYTAFSPEDLERLEYVLPKTVDIPRVVQNIHTVAEEARVEITDITLGEKRVSEKSPYIRHIVKVGMKGSYASFVSFLENMETSLQLSNVTGISVGRVKNKSNSDLSAPYTVDFSFYQAK